MASAAPYAGQRVAFATMHGKPNSLAGRSWKLWEPT